MQSFKNVYEPSGLVQLGNGHILIIEDEKKHPFSLLALKSNNTFKRLALTGQLQTSEGKAAALNDLEGVTYGKDGWIYAITSHSRNSKKKRDASREQLIRFRINENHLSDYQIATKSLFIDALQNLLPKKKLQRQLNIEGLAYDRQKEHLLVGLRAPLLNDKAVLMRIKNPEILFERDNKKSLSFEKISLDLKGNSIRSIEYDPHLHAYLLVAGSVKNRDKPFQLWLWKANKKPQRIDLSAIGKIGYTEGITPIKDAQGNPTLLLVQDDGQRDEQSAGHYLFVSYKQLAIN